MTTCMASGGASAARVDYLSDVILGIGTFMGYMGVDTTPYRVWPKAIAGMPIRIKDKDYAKGLGVDAPGEMVVALDGAYESFDAEVGVQWQGNPVGEATFQVFADGKELFSSGVMRETDPPKPLSLSVSGVKEMRLVVTGVGMSNWANARLTKSSSAESAAGAAGVDMSPFARVVTYDPERMDGARVDRLTEFPAGDVFFDTDVKPSGDGSYTAPVGKSGLGCIGLQWIETRRIREIGLEFPEGSQVPPIAGVRAEYWAGLGIDYVSGESNWQGSWRPMRGQIERRGDSLVVASSQETRKIRWVFPASEKPVVIRRLWANTTSSYKVASVLLQLEKPMPGKHAEVEVYNGEILEPAGSKLRCKWDLAAPLRLKVNYTTPRPWGLDRTVLRVELPTGAFGVAVDDLLPDEFPPGPAPRPGVNTRFKAVDDVIEDLYPLGCVYVKDYGFFATAEPAKLTLAQYKDKIKGRKTILEQVREMPDQSWPQAVEKLYYSLQDNGPTMVSLAWDNRKVVVDRTGAIHYGPEFLDFVEYKHRYEVSPQFGSGANAGFSRKLDNGWMPIPHISVEGGGLVYHQAVFVAPFGKADSGPGAPWLYDRPICVAEYTIENPRDTPAAASLKLSFFSDWKTREPAQMESLPGRVIAVKQDQLLAVAEIAPASSLSPEVKDGTLTLMGTVPGKSQVRCLVYMPVEWEIKPADQATLAGGADLRKAAEDYWRRAMAPAMHIDIPDAQLENLIVGSQVHCMNASRNEEGGKLVEARIAATYYGSLDGESDGIIRGMDFTGNHDFARRALGYFVKREKPAGYFSHGYTLMGTGHHLSGLSRHYWLTGDTGWWSEIEPRVAKMCDWMARQSEKTKRLDLDGQKVPEYGLQPPGTAADWQHWGYLFHSQSHYYEGVRYAARALADSHYPRAAEFARFAEQYRKELERAFHWTQQRMSVYPLRDGTWVPGGAYEVYSPGPIQQFFPNYTIRAYESMLGAHQLGSQEVLDPNGKDAAWIMNYLEDIDFLRYGDYGNENPRYHDGRKADSFDWGGVQKSQPYLMRNSEVYALRDDVKPFVRAYFNTAAACFNREDMSFWEGIWAGSVWDKTAETGRFLYQCRLMFVEERGEELWLAPFVTNHWMQDGMTVAIGNAPSYFGPVSYRIHSHIKDGFIEATVDPPSRKTPKALVIRLRHPDEKRMTRVSVNGKNHRDFDPAKEIVRIKARAGEITVRAYY